jgi:hypothetical protein
MIITLAQVKSLLNISGTAKDTLISALIPEAEAKYLQIRNIPFMQIQADITSGDATVSNLKLYPCDVLNSLSSVLYDNSTIAAFIDRTDYFYNSSQSIDNYVTEIDVENNTIELDTAPAATATDVIFTVYPKGSKFVAAKLIQYFMQSNSMNGLQSESVGSYSYSRGGSQGGGNPFGVPDDIYKSIKRYVDC